MSEMELGGEVKLTVPQLRVYLNCMKRSVDIYEKGGSLNPEDGLIYANHCQAFGIKTAVEQLLRALNLPEDWVERMDKKEADEVRRHLPKKA